MSSINEAGNCEMISFIDRTGSFNQMDHRAGDDIRIDDSQVKGRLVLFEEFPCCCFCPSFGHIVTENGVVPINGLLCSDLY